MFALRDLFVVLVVFGSIPFILVRPPIGILMWSWIAYMVPHKMTWGFAFDLPIAQVIGLATLLGLLLYREEKKLPLNAITFFMGLFVFWFSLTTIFAVVPDLAQKKWEQAFKILLMTFVTIMLMRSKERIEALIWVIVVSIGFFGIKGGIWFLLGGQGLVWGPRGGYFGDNNALAMTLIMVIPLMWYLQMRTSYFILRWGLRAAIFLCLIAVVGTFSRGAAIAVVAMGAFLFIKSRRRGLLGVAFVGIIIVGIPFIPSSWFDRVESIKTFEQDGSAMGRIHAWTFATKLAIDRPLVGGGFKVNGDADLFLSYVPYAEKARAFHSVYFEVLAEHGFAGLAIFLALALATYRSGSQIIRRTRNQPELAWANDLARMLQVCLVGYGVGGAFLNMAFFDLYYHFVAIMLLVNCIVAEQLPKKAEAADRRPDRRSLVRGAQSPAYPLRGRRPGLTGS